MPNVLQRAARHLALPSTSPPDPLSCGEGAPAREVDPTLELARSKSGAPSPQERGSGGEVSWHELLRFVAGNLPFPLRRSLIAGLLLLPALTGCFSNNRHQGEKLYAQHCAGCHGEQGQGLARLIPPLAGSDYLAAHRAELACLLRQGQNEAIVVNGVGYHNIMPGNKALSPAQVTNLLNYVESHWGNEAAPRTIRDVQAQLDKCH